MVAGVDLGGDGGELIDPLGDVFVEVCERVLAGGHGDVVVTAQDCETMRMRRKGCGEGEASGAAVKPPAEVVKRRGQHVVENGRRWRKSGFGVCRRVR